jgi:predicted  nucleic acid-binding Zn-ribbon protein
MKCNRLFAVAAIFLMSFSAYSQVVSSDSIDVLKARKEMLGISRKLNACRLELAEKENEVLEKTNAVTNAAVEAQRSADDNKAAAVSLEQDPQDRKLARRAKKAARQAHRDAKNARKAQDRLEKLNREIESLKKQIAEYEAKLKEFPAAIRQ